MKQKLSLLLILAISLFISTSCLDEGEVPQEKIEVDYNTKSVDATQQSLTLTVTANKSWYIKASDNNDKWIPWITAKKSTTNKDEAIITLEENTTGQDRVAKVVVTSYRVSETITITQRATTDPSEGGEGEEEGEGEETGEGEESGETEGEA